MKKKFLTNALEYAESNMDTERFCDMYLFYRKEEDIHISTFMALESLYGWEVANKIQEESAVPFI